MEKIRLRDLYCDYCNGEVIYFFHGLYFVWFV